MQNSHRRVKKLTLRSRHESTFTSDLHALQDAFNIASFPGVPPNGLLLVRKLDLGVLAPNSTAQLLSRSIDHRMQTLRFQSVCVDEADAPGHDVVWFSDRAYALARLVNLVARSHPINAWYWQVLVPGCKPDMTLAEVLILVGRQLVDQASGLQVMAAVIQQLCTQGQTEKTIASITPSLARVMLAASAIYPDHLSSITPQRDSLSSAGLNISSTWHKVIATSIITWGKQDVRTHWMAVNALIISNPALVKTGSLLSERVHSLLDHVDQALDIADSVKATDTFDISAEPVDDTPETERERTKEHNRLEVSASCGTGEDGLSDESQSAMGPGVDTKITGNGSPNRGGALSPQLSDADKQVYAEHKPKAATSKLQVLQRTKSARRADARYTEINQTTGLTPQPAYTGLLYNHQAGFVFLIASLELLRVDECLALNPRLAVINLPVRVIRRFADRYNIENHHPLLQALPEQQNLDQEAIKQFVCPSCWIPLSNPRLKQQMTLYRYAIKGGIRQCFITDHHRKLVFYIGDSNPNVVPEWITQCRIRDQPGLHDYPVQRDIETTIQLLTSRYLFRYAGTGLRALINHHGRIALTRTHLDVVFAFDQMAIRIRRAGLDINPGWVAWLGKVVQFHYDSGEQDDV